MKPLSAFLFFAGLLATRVEAGTGTGTSGNATVDTTVAAGNVTVTMHRADRAALANADSNAGADDRLLVKAATAAELASQPPLPAWDYVSGSGGGLVADGVTPLIFRITATGTPPPGGARYEVTVAGKWVPIILPYPGPLLSLPGSTVVPPRLEVTLTPAQPVAFVVLNAIRSEDLIASGYAGPVVARIDVRDSMTGNLKGGLDFGISRPPVVLVHGYNVSDPNWGQWYNIKLNIDRAPGFVIPIGYGYADCGEVNTTWDLKPLVRLLWEQLLFGVEKPGSRPAVLNQWAWTRYDAVGHSQGGVLLRLLCSQQDKAIPPGGTVQQDGFDPWRNARNFHRGRFHRVVTIGSPHMGSTLGELGWQLRNRGVLYGIPFAEFVNAAGGAFGPYACWLQKGDFDRLFQPKFRIGSGRELANLNAELICDPEAKLHLVRTTIAGGSAPGSGGGGWQALYYAMLHLDRSTPTVLNPATGQMETPGQLVAPNGSDGVVDLLSQGAGGGLNKITTLSGHDISHAVLGDSDTQSETVATTVRNLLNGPAANFGKVEIPASLNAASDAQRARIVTLAQRIDAAQTRANGPLILLLLNGGDAQAGEPLPPPPTSFADQTLNFVLQPPAGETPSEQVEWEASVYVPAGITSAGLSLVPSGGYGEQLALTVGAAVIGEVVVRVRFLSASGQIVVGTPLVVLSRPPGTALTGIAVDPGTFQGQVGVELPLTVSGIYDGQIATAIFTSAANTTFQSSNTVAATVDGSGRVTLAGLGTATINATYNGTHTATCVVTVLDAAPIVVNPSTIPATVGQPLTFQLSASQVVQSFSIDALPAGLTLDAQSGLIEGVPTTEGRFPAVVTVQNANGTGSKQMEFVIAGVPGAPTDVGVDAAGVNGGKPVGTVIGRLVTVDPNPLDTFTYQLVSGAGGTDNARFTIAGDSLVTAGVLDGAATSTASIRVRTTDASGASFEKALVLPVGTPPAITRQPDARTVFAGESAIFFVETTGLEPLQYQWKKDGADVAGATSRIFEVPAAALADAGNYTVAVSNGDGSVTSAAASLVVNPISYGRWASSLPSGMASALFEPGADYNADGIVNLLDFAFGVQPGLESGVGAQPFVSRDALGYVLTYREANGIAPLTYRILKSVDLGTWVEHVPTVGEVTRTDLGTHTVVAVRLPVANPGVFFKLEVSGQ